MTEPPDARLRRRLDLLGHRRASMAADRAAFETRRRHGLASRHKAKLAHLAARDRTDSNQQEEPTPEPDNTDEAA